MAFTDTPPNTGASLSALSSDSIRALWQRTVDIFEQSEDFFAEFEGEGVASPIRIKTETAKGAGQKITITTRAGYYGEGKSGDALFESESDFEKTIIGSYNVQVDWLRNATRSNERMEEVMGMRGEIESGDAEQLGKWMGRQKTDRMMMTFREKGDTGNLMLAGGKLSQDTLVTADGLLWDEITYMKARLEPLGGRAAKVGRVNGTDVLRYLVIGTTPGLLSLSTDSDYKEICKETGVRGDGNTLFTGGFVDVDGNMIKKYNPIDHDGYGPVGSSWNPKAFLGVAIVGATTAVDVKGGGSAGAAADTTKMYFKFFDNYAFEFLPGDILVAGTSERYFLIVNPRDAALGADSGKIGMYAYTTGNNGNKITVTKRIGASDSDARVMLVGSVTWDTGVWSGVHTVTHPVGALIVQCNAKGVPLGDTVMLGSSAAMRGYGKYRNHRSQDTKNGGFVTERFISSVFGQSLRKDVLGRAPGYVRLRHAVNYAGYGIPTVTS